MKPVILDNPDAGVDLHLHTSASDGSNSPEEVVNLAADNNVSIIAITDHDTMVAVPRAIAQGKQRGLSVIPGIEISASYNSESVHILGLGIKKVNNGFRETLKKIHDGRLTRNPRIVQNLNIAGMDLTLKDVQDCAGGDIIGRPHIAQAMLNKGYVETTDQAFKQYLIRGAKAYVERYRPDVLKATTLIREAGGIPVLAHPGLMKYENFSVLKNHIQSLKKLGIEALETHYPCHSPTVFSILSQFAREFDLLETGGSDFHGIHKPNRIGLGCDFEKIPFSFARPFLERLGKLISRQEIKTDHVHCK
ncbi:PHP domain-containing protein [bacterium]|nr:PHP domain-containing protein [bacterium]